MAKYDAAGTRLASWGPQQEHLQAIAVEPSGNVTVNNTSTGTVLVYGYGEVCPVPQEAAGEPEPPPAVGNWLFAGCWRKTGATRWEATGQVNLNGLLVTPDTGGKIVLDTSGPSLAAVGQATVETGAFTVGGVSRPSIQLHHGSLNWSLSAASLPLPLQQGLKLLGLGSQDTSATVTPGPNPGDVSLGPITVGLPDLIGGTGEITLKLRPGGVQVSSWRIGPTQRLLGGLVPVQDLVLEANDQGWGVGGAVVIPGSPNSTVGGSIAFNAAGQLSGASVTAGNLELFGGVLPVRSFVFSWSAANGWRAAAAAQIPGQAGSTVGIDLTYANGALSAGDFFVQRASLGGVAQINAMDLNYQAEQERWVGTASVTLGGPSGATVDGSFVLLAGQFVSGTIDVTNQNKLLGPGVTLTRLAAAFGTDPWRFSGTVQLGAGPTIEGQPAVRINGNGAYTYPAGNQPGAWHVDANVQLTDFQLLSGSLDYLSTGRATFEGHLGPAGGFNFGGVTLDADLNGWVDRTAGYSAEGSAAMTVNGLNITGRAVVSSTGVAACGGVQSGWTWQAGLAYRWVGNQLTVLANSCDLRPWTTQPPPAAPSLQEGTGTPAATFVVPADQPVHAVQFTGTTGPPLVTLEGPNGESLATPTAPEDLGVQGPDHLVVQDVDAKTTTFMIDTPSAGTWEAFLQPGSSPLAEVATADGLDDPEVTATVSGSGATRTLSWQLTPVPGQVVTFVEQGPETAQVIATTSAATGEAVFAPADGPAGTRDIVALVEQDGVPRAEIVAGSYAAPGGATLTVERTGTGGQVTSAPAGIDCGTTCGASYPPGTEVTLTATPDPGGTFDGWTGPCEGTDPCTVTVDVATTVGAGFTAPDDQAPSAPSVTGPSAALQTGNGFTVTWGGATDADGTVASYDVRYRLAGLNGAFGSPVDWQSATTATSVAFTGAAAKAYCFSARATDDDGATSAWSTERCTATPLDDRGLSAAGGFARLTQSGNLANTYSQALRANATLTRNGVTARRIGIIVQRCNGCGTVRVRHAGVTLGTINLQAPTVRKKQLVTYTLPTTRSGALVLTVTSANRPVRIDGIVALPG